MNIETEMLIFCENVKRLRKRANLSKTAMSKKLGIGIKTLISIESGKLPERLSYEILLAIHYHFGIMPSDMVSEIIKLSDE